LLLGLNLAKLVRGRWPPIQIIATSGRLAVKDGDLPDGGLFQPKPYNADKLTATIREIKLGIILGKT
jgi:hypothetical protein